MDWTERRTRFRALIEGDRCVHPGSVFDAMSARIAEDLGFEIGMFAGSPRRSRCLVRRIISFSRCPNSLAKPIASVAPAIWQSWWTRTMDMATR